MGFMEISPTACVNMEISSPAPQNTSFKKLAPVKFTHVPYFTVDNNLRTHTHTHTHTHAQVSGVESFYFQIFARDKLQKGVLSAKIKWKQLFWLGVSTEILSLDIILLQAVGWLHNGQACMQLA